MSGKFIKIVLFIGAAVLVGYAVANLQGPRAKDDYTVRPQSENQPVGTQDVTGTELTGILSDSDDIEKGNLMLRTDERTVYLNTVRDFSDFVGAEVVLTIEGDRDNFRLLDIRRK